MNASRNIPAKLSIDSSVLIAYFLGEPEGRIVKEKILFDGREVHSSHLTLAETFYVLCRTKNHEFAMKAMETLAKTRYLKIHESTALDYAAASYKCERKLSLADCYVLALARETHAPATFAKRETDLTSESRRRPFDVELVFLEDLVQPP